MPQLVLALTVFLVTVSVHAETDSVSPHLDYLDSIDSCEELARKTEERDLNDPKFSTNRFRGVEYTPLYMAFHLDCLALGREMINRGANPNKGGLLGSLLYTAVLSDDDEAAIAWTLILLGAGATPSHITGWLDPDTTVDEYIRLGVKEGWVNTKAFKFYTKAIKWPSQQL